MVCSPGIITKSAEVCEVCMQSLNTYFESTNRNEPKVSAQCASPCLFEFYPPLIATLIYPSLDQGRVSEP